MAVSWSYTRVAASQLRCADSRRALVEFVRQAWEPRVHVVVDDDPKYGRDLIDFLRQFQFDPESGPQPQPMDNTR